MNKINLIAGLIVFPCATLTFAQTTEKKRFSICNTINDTIRRSELNKCYYLISTDKRLKVKSFEISFVLKLKQGETTGGIAMYPSEGDKFSNVAREDLKKYRPDRFYIENIIASDGNVENKYVGFTIFMK